MMKSIFSLTILLYMLPSMGQSISQVEHEKVLKKLIEEKMGIKDAAFFEVGFDYWEGCETGEGECKPLTITRSEANEAFYLVMPCGGTFTSVTLSQKPGIAELGNIQAINVTHETCPPIFNLSNLSDGKYYAYMLACGLGGQIEFNLVTEAE